MADNVRVSSALVVRLRPGAAVSRRVVTRYAVVVLAALVCANLHVRRPPTLSVLRAVTGVPCPFCGGTTSTVDLAHGNVVGAFGASPIAPLLLVAFPWVGRLRVPKWLHSRVLRWSVIGVVLVASEVWQLARFGLLHG